MLSLQDCLEYVRLTEAEIDAIAEHEHLPPIIAAELANYLIETPQGVPTLKRMIIEDIEHAVARGDWAHAGKLRMVLKHFVATHPEQGPCSTQGNSPAG
jgi:hypothetical protein